MTDTNSKHLTNPLLQRMHSFEKKTFFKNMADEKAEKKPYSVLFEENWKSGMTVGLVNLPLSIALAVASGSTPSAGIISAIIGGIVSGILGGSHYNIVGPTGALSGFLAAAVFRYGPACLPYISIASGLVILLIKQYNLAKYIDLFPTTVNEGFTLGVAFIIFLNQLNGALGITKIKIEVFDHSVDSNSVAHIQEEESLIHKTVNTLKHIDQMNPQDFIIFLIFFISLYILLKKYPKVPWHMVAALVGIALSSSQIIKVQTLKSKFGDFSLDLTSINYLKQISPTFFFDIRLWVDTLPIAFISVLESLISAKIADEMTHTHFNKTKEVHSLAISNLLSGLFGGVPVTAALARTTLNIRSGATRKFSSLINGVFLLIISVLFLFLFRHLPLCVASAQVCMVAVRMVNMDEINHMYAKDKKNFYILIAIAAICILQDPTVGIIFGILIYLISFCDSLTYPWSEIITTHEKKVQSGIGYESSVLHHQNSNKGKSDNFAVENLSLFLSDLPAGEGDYVLYRVIGIINFMNVKEHTEKIKTLAENDHVCVVISFRYLHYIDLEAMHAIKHLIHEVCKEKKKRSFDGNAVQHKIVITGLSKYNIDGISDKDWIEELKSNDLLIYKENPTMHQSNLKF